MIFLICKWKISHSLVAGNQEEHGSSLRKSNLALKLTYCRYSRQVSRGVGKLSWEQKQAARQEASLQKLQMQSHQEMYSAKQEMEKKKRALKAKRKLENQLKSTITQTITNSGKLKRLSKRQRKSIRSSASS